LSTYYVVPALSLTAGIVLAWHWGRYCAEEWSCVTSYLGSSAHSLG